MDVMVLACSLALNGFLVVLGGRRQDGTRPLFARKGRVVIRATPERGVEMTVITP
ncbi:hypothetical protein [Micromonospora sp. WMMC273]|uniref:hypothetical protein n=1 Tax=Micromonospora sp. WMMC273 TaxID=3015157 RepID=UPI0022B626B8|nr:hypothetical protein [Micromonospora sp. WMMC273]MCZ7478840.1 hypothetical protein [Micromonospora sp. WMMC273]